MKLTSIYVFSFTHSTCLNTSTKTGRGGILLFTYSVDTLIQITSPTHQPTYLPTYHLFTLTTPATLPYLTFQHPTVELNILSLSLFATHTSPYGRTPTIAFLCHTLPQTVCILSSHGQFRLAGNLTGTVQYITSKIKHTQPLRIYSIEYIKAKIFHSR